MNEPSLSGHDLDVRVCELATGFALGELEEAELRELYDLLRDDAPRTFEYVARRLGEREIAFICAREYVGPNRLGPKLKAAFGGVYIANEKFTHETAEQAVEAGEADAVAFGKLFIANPDLPQRFALRASLNDPRVAEFYAGGAEGYTDYPSLSHAEQSADSIGSRARVNARASTGA